MGKLYEDKKKLRQAKKCYEKSLKLEPRYIDTYILLTKIFIDLEELPDAIETLKAAIGREGDESEVYYYLTNCYLIVKDYEKALKFIDKCLIIDENYEDAVLLRKDLECVLSLNKN